MGEQCNLFVVGILGHSFVAQQLEHLPDTEGNERPDHGTDPVDPVVDGERLGGNTGAKSTGRVETGTGVVDTDQVSQEQRDTNDHGGKSVSRRLFHRHEKHSKTQQRGTEGFDHKTTTLGAATTETVGESNGTGSHGRGGTSSSHTSDDLGNHHEQTPDGVDGTSSDQSKGDSRVQVTTRDSGDEENGHHDPETETERDHDQLLRRRPLGFLESGILQDGFLVGNLSNHEGDPQEDEGPDQFPQHRQQVIQDGRRSEVDSWARCTSSGWRRRVRRRHQVALRDRCQSYRIGYGNKTGRGPVGVGFI